MVIGYKNTKFIKMAENNLNSSNPIELSKLPRGAISIRGIPIGRNSRLPSFKSPRDLTLGSGIKRTFTPNIPVRREKRSEDRSLAKNMEAKDTNRTNSSRPLVRDKQVFVQTPGAVFGEGITQPTKKVSLKSSDNKSSGPSPSKPSLKQAVLVKTEPLDDEYLSDNFIDDCDVKVDWKLNPVVVPLSNDSFSKIDISQNDTAIVVKKENPLKDTVDLKSFEELSLNADMIDSEELFLFELPTYFCDSISTESSSQDGTNDDKMIPSDWSNVDEGYIGKLQFLSNGKSRLKIGNNAFDVISNHQTPFLQELVSIQTLKNPVEMAVLGNINHTVRFVPKIDET